MEPDQIRAVDPFQSYNSERVNKLTRIVTGGEDKLLSDDALRVSPKDGSSQTSLSISQGICIKDDVLIQIASTSYLDLTVNGNYCNNDSSTGNGGDSYVVLDYYFERDREPRKAKILISSISNYLDSGTNYLFLARITKDLDGYLTNVYDFDPENGIYRSVNDLTDSFSNQDAFNFLDNNWKDSNTISPEFDSVNVDIYAHVIPDNTTIENSVDGIRLKDNGITESKISSSVFSSGIIGGSGSKVKLGVISEDWNLVNESEWDLSSDAPTITKIPDPIGSRDVVPKYWIEDRIDANINSEVSYSGTEYLDNKTGFKAGITTLDTELATHANNIDSTNPHSVSLEDARTIDNIFQGYINMGGFPIQGVADPNNDQDVATKSYVDGSSGGGTDSTSSSIRFSEQYTDNSSSHIEVIHNLSYYPMVQVINIGLTNPEVIYPETVTHPDVNSFDLYFDENNIPSDIQVLYW